MGWGCDSNPSGLEVAVYEILLKTASALSPYTATFWLYIQWWGFKLNIKSSQSLYDIEAPPSPQMSQGAETLDRSTHTVWHGACWRQSIVSNCFQMLCTRSCCIFWPWVVIPSVSAGASYEFSSAKPPPSASLVSKWTSCPLPILQEVFQQLLEIILCPEYNSAPKHRLRKTQNSLWSSSCLINSLFMPRIHFQKNTECLSFHGIFWFWLVYLKNCMRLREENPP